MNGKLTKTEGLMLVLAAVFLAALALLYNQAASAAAGTDYTISTQRRAEEPVTPERPQLPEPRGPIDLNTAGPEELQALSGVGPVLAQRIIDYREEHGPFQSVEELLEVKGIGPATLEKFREDVTVSPPPEEPGADTTQDDSEEDMAA